MSADLDAPEHELCSDAINARDREIRWQTNRGDMLKARAEKAEAEVKEGDAAVLIYSQRAIAAEAEVARLRAALTKIAALARLAEITLCTTSDQPK